VSRNRLGKGGGGPDGKPEAEGSPPEPRPQGRPQHHVAWVDKLAAVDAMENAKKNWKNRLTLVKLQRRQKGFYRGSEAGHAHRGGGKGLRGRLPEDTVPARRPELMLSLQKNRGRG